MGADMSNDIDTTFLRWLAGLASAAIVGIWGTIVGLGHRYVGRKEMEKEIRDINKGIGSMEKAIATQGETKTEIAVIHERMRHGDERFSKLEEQISALSHDLGSLQAAQSVTNSRLENLGGKIDHLIEAVERGRL